MTHHFSGNSNPTTTIIILIATYFSSQSVTGLGVGSTISVSYSSTTSPIVCGILASQPTQSIECYIYNNRTISVKPKTSFQSIAGGRGFFCGLRSGGYSLLCWNTTDFRPKRIHFDPINPLTSLTAGKSQICAIQETTGIALCWRFPSPAVGLQFRSVTSGRGFSCGVLQNNRKVKCWGENGTGDEIETRFGSFEMLSLVAGLSHACGVIKNGTLICRGRNHGGQLHVPTHSPFEFSSNLALGGNHSCAIKRANGFVVCWGGGLRKLEFNNVVTNNVSFESIVAGLDFTCGLTSKNLLIICWGPGWDGENVRNLVPIGKTIPGPCVHSSCNKCGVYPNSEVLCGGSGNICRKCEPELPIPAIPQPKVQPIGNRKRVLLAFAIVGSVGAFVSICSILYCLWCGMSRRKVTKRPNNLDNVDAYSSPSRSISGTVRSHRSGASSKHLEKAESFTLSDLAIATQGFSTDNKIGGGSFGMVYRGKLTDGREVAIKRGDTRLKPKKFQEKDSAFESELALLSRLHHKHLVDLIGFCEEDEERLLVYEYMSNGSLHDHLHKYNTDYINYWTVRIKIALATARGIEYLHNYAVPPIIHRDIKSSNILLDAKFTAKVSDFGLSLLGPRPDSEESMSAKAVGTVGYIDPEYYVLNILTTKSDVYGFGVVLLEILTGKRAVFKDEGTGPMTVVEYARPRIATGELRSVLDKRVELSEIYETEAVELVAYTALQCVNLEGIERPNMDDIVANLERALAICKGHHRRLSSTTFSGTSQ